MSDPVGWARRSRPVPLLACLLAAAACGPRLHIESARVIRAGADAEAPARLELTAGYSRLVVDPRRPLRLHIGDGVRWVFLRPVEGETGVWAVDGSEHGYGLSLDLAREHVELVEPIWPPQEKLSIDVAIGQGRRRACTRMWVEPVDGGWAFSGRQARCGKPQGSR